MPGSPLSRRWTFLTVAGVLALAAGALKWPGHAQTVTPFAPKTLTAADYGRAERLHAVAPRR